MSIGLTEMLIFVWPAGLVFLSYPFRRRDLRKDSSLWPYTRAKKMPNIKTLFMMSNLSSLILLNVYNLDPVFITFIEYRIDKPETKVYHSQIDVDLQFLFHQLSQIEKKKKTIVSDFTGWQSKIIMHYSHYKYWQWASSKLLDKNFRFMPFTKLA